MHLPNIPMTAELWRNGTTKMTKKIIYIALAALLGAGIGAFLSYGPLKRFKSEAGLNIDLDIAGYKRFAQMVNDPARFRQYATKLKPQALTDDQIIIALQDITNADWLKPVPRFARADVKDLPDLAVRLEQESIRLREQDQANEIEKLIGKKLPLIRNEYSAYTGIYLATMASTPEMATAKVNWLSNYAFDTAAHGAVEQLIAKWVNDNKLISENILAVKIQQEYAREQLKFKIAGFKKAAANTPTIAKADVESFTLSTQNPSKTMTPRAHLMAAEIELLESESILHRLNRAIEQQKIANEIAQQVSTQERTQQTGYERIRFLDDLLTATLNKTESPSLREKLLLMRMDVSNIKAHIYKKPAYIFQATTPKKQGPSTLKIIVLCSVFLAFLMSIIVWRKVFMKHLIQDANTFSIQNKP